MYDYHAHSQYSDGAQLTDMVAAAADAGLDGIGFADHCNLTSEEKRQEWGFILDEVYKERREVLQSICSSTDIEVFDAVEICYDPGGEEIIQSFLDKAGFDYTIGSVHYLDGIHTSHRGAFKDRNDLPELIDQYYNDLIALIESELFDIVAHADVFRRNPTLRGYTEQEHYERVAAALADKQSILEINAGRVNQEYGQVHPGPEFFKVLAEHDVPFTVGTDSHKPNEIGPRVNYLREFLSEMDIDPVSVHL